MIRARGPGTPTQVPVGIQGGDSNPRSEADRRGGSVRLAMIELSSHKCSRGIRDSGDTRLPSDYDPAPALPTECCVVVLRVEISGLVVPSKTLSF